MSDTLRVSRPQVVRKRSRRQQRGAAMVEAAFMMPMFIILFFTSLYAHNLNAKQIELNSQTRAGAWAFAMVNCGPSGDSPTETPSTGGPGNGVSQQQLFGQGGNDAASAASTALGSGNTTGAISSIAAPITSFIANLLPDPQGSQGQLIQTVNWRQPNVYSGADPSNQTNVQQTVTLVCNQEPKNGNPVTAVEGLACAVLGKGC